MNDVMRVLELGLHPVREGAAMLPSLLVDEVRKAVGAPGAILGRDREVLACAGESGGDTRRIELAAGRDTFWLELNGGRALTPALRAAAAVVLSAWQAREELKRARFAERRRLWELESLRAIAEALGGTLEPTHIAEELLLNATALLDARRGEVWLTIAGEARALARLTGATGTDLCATGDCIAAARVGGQVLSEEQARLLPADGLLEERRLAVPVTGRRGRLGVLALAEREVRGGTAPFSATDAETLALFATQAAVALESATLHGEALDRERLERELELAATIQRQLLPTSFPTPAGLELAAKSEPSRRVGGDLYDLMMTPRGLFLVLGDLAGKGIPAALMAASLQAAVRLLVRGGPPLEELAAQLNAHVLSSTPETKFATLFLAYLKPEGRLDWVSAGHLPALVVTPEGGCELLGAVGPPLGLLPDIAYPSRWTALAPGGMLVVYSDGLSEAPGASAGDDFGAQRIAALVTERRQETLAGVVASLFAAVAAHTAGAPPHDDRTVLAVRRLPM